MAGYGQGNGDPHEKTLAEHYESVHFYTTGYLDNYTGAQLQQYEDEHEIVNPIILAALEAELVDEGDDPDESLYEEDVDFAPLAQQAVQMEDDIQLAWEAAHPGIIYEDDEGDVADHGEGFHDDHAYDEDIAEYMDQGHGFFYEDGFGGYAGDALPGAPNE